MKKRQLPQHDRRAKRAFHPTVSEEIPFVVDSRSMQYDAEQDAQLLLHNTHLATENVMLKGENERLKRENDSLYEQYKEQSQTLDSCTRELAEVRQLRAETQNKQVNFGRMQNALREKMLEIKALERKLRGCQMDMQMLRATQT